MIRPFYMGVNRSMNNENQENGFYYKMPSTSKYACCYRSGRRVINVRHAASDHRKGKNFLLEFRRKLYEPKQMLSICCHCPELTT